MANYWDLAITSRISRRRGLMGAGGALAGAALLAACGGGEKEQTKPVSELIHLPKDTLKDAVRGGTLKDWQRADPASFNVTNTDNALTPIARDLYGSLLREEPGYLGESGGVIGGDLAEKWEFSPDHMQMTMKLRPGVKWHNRAPVNARRVEMDDVLYSYRRFAAMSALRELVANEVNPSAPVLSVTSTDATTLVVKLKEPLVYAHKFFAPYGSYSGNMLMIPREADDGSFDIRRDLIGHGPLQLESYTPSVGLTRVRNPDYWEKDFILVDKVEEPFISEYAARLAQFKAGNLHYLSPEANDVVSVKREDSRLLLIESDVSAPSTVLTFGLLPEGKSPFLDERVRQAFSMGIDRDLWIDARRNVSRFQAEGLDVETRWSTHILSKWKGSGVWLDPKSKDFGPNAKYFHYDLAEAKSC